MEKEAMEKAITSLGCPHNPRVGIIYKQANKVYNICRISCKVKSILYSLAKWMDHLSPASYVGILGVALVVMCCVAYFDKKEEEKKHREKQRRDYPVTWELEKLQAAKRASLASGHKSIRSLHLL